MMKNYDHNKIEKKWQKDWDKNGVYKTESGSKKKKQYVLDMFPYPSGAGLHVGHPRGYIGSDVYARLRRMQGFNVLHPMGYDAFGLPAEQYAIEHKIHPRKAVEVNVATFERQLSVIGLSYDWSRKVNTTDPEYYKWTQWIFLQIYDSWYDKTKDKARPITELVEIFEKNGNQDVDAVSDQGFSTIFSKDEWKNYADIERQDILMKYRLAYEGYALVNWCPKLGTVLANDEIVDDKDGNPVSERGGYPVEKISMRQWFMRITAYSDRLLSDLKDLDWSTHIKEIQKNWIGKSEGSEIFFPLVFKSNPKLNANMDKEGNKARLPVFTTRADTIYGATYMVLSPEHLWVTLAIDDNHIGVLDNRDEVKAYVESAKKKNEIERASDTKEKTGVELKGVKAINPANGEEIPIWVADYVLAGYGTGAIMAVPAHDERDYAFAKKYDLPIKSVVEMKYYSTDSPIREGLPIVPRNVICAIIRNPKDDTYLCSVWKKHHMHGLITGGVEDGEDMIEAALREIHEETGYKNVKLRRDPNVAIHSYFYHRMKEQNRWARFQYLMFELIDEERDEIDEQEASVHDIVWKNRSELENFFSVVEGRFMLELIDNEDYIYTGEGLLHDSGKFTGIDSQVARTKITEAVGGKIVTRYKMRDAIFARQRYWGEPIPLKRDKDTGIITALKEKELPLELPDVKSYEPTGTGESPLASVKAWIKEGYETNTMPGWAGSSWYFLRYMDPKNKKEFASKKDLEYWKDVDMYIGGQEHATGHLLYSRFWHKFLFDLGYVPTKEPFRTLKNQGLIIASDGRKMSKRWGNVINPDEIIKTYGADTLRIYEMFMGPFDQTVTWSTDSIIGPRRFIERVYRLKEKTIEKYSEPNAIEKILHKTIKKVTEDIEAMNFNTAISAMMVLINEIEKNQTISVSDYKLFLQILAPFAPHVTEELWRESGEKESIHQSSWPEWDEKKIIDDEIKIAISVNGKVRTEMMISREMSEDDIKRSALDDPSITPWLLGKEVKRVVYVKGRLINIVV
jgi:leucyl-tRNA synthetase